jgi:hypothetical protein
MAVSGSEFYVDALDCKSVMNGLSEFVGRLDRALVYDGVSCSGPWTVAGDSRSVVLGTFGAWNGHAGPNVTYTVVFAEANPSMFELPLPSAMLIAAAAFGLLAVAFVFRIAIAALRDDGA